MRRSTKYATIAVLIFGLVLIFHAGLLLLSPVLENRIEKALGKKIDAKVEIEGLILRFFTETSIDSITISPLTSDSEKPNALQMAGVDIGLSFPALLSGRYRPENIRIRSIELSAYSHAIDWITSLPEKTRTGGKIPALKIEKGNIKLQSHVFGKPLQITNLKVSGPRGGPVKATCRAFFDNCKNSFELNLNWTGTAVEAELQAKDFAVSCLPSISNHNIKFDPAGLAADEKLTGKLLARYSVETEILTVQNALFDTNHGSLAISSAGLGIDENGINLAWLQADLRRINPSIIKNLTGKDFINNKIKAQIQNGRINIGTFVHWSKDGGLDYEAEVSVRNAAVYLPEIKTMVENIEADLEIFSPGRILIHRSRGWVSNGKVEITGFLDFKDSSVMDHRLEFILNDISGHDKMYLLFPSDLRAVIEDMKIQNPEVNGRMLLTSKETGINLRVRAGQVSLPGIPFEIGNPEAEIRWNSDGEQISFTKCKGYLNGGFLEGKALLEFREPFQLDFTVYGRQLPVNSEMLTWLDMNKAPWGISGSYDVELRADNWHPEAESPGSAIKKINIQADLKNLSIRHPGYGTVADNWYGHLAVDNKGARMTDFRGDILGVGFHANGNLPAENRSNATLRLESENIELDEKDYGHLPFGKFMNKAGLAGQFKLSAQLESPGQNWLPDKGSVSAVIHNLDAGDDSLNTGFSGTTRFEFSGLDKNDSSLEGEFDLGGINLNQFEANRIAGKFKVNNEIIKIPEMKINAYGGNLDFADSSINTENLNWKTKFSMARIDLESVVGAFGITGRNAPSGSLRGNIEMRGKELNPADLSGSGTIKISHGLLYEFPIIASVFNVMDLQFPRQAPITDAYGTFETRTGALRINDLLLTGGTVPMHMEGKVGLKNGISFKKQKIDLLVTAARADGLLDRIPLVGLVKHYTLDLFRRLAMQVRIEGTVGNYRTDRLASPVTKPIERMWSLMEKLAPSLPER